MPKRDNSLTYSKTHLNVWILKQQADAIKKAARRDGRNIGEFVVRNLAPAVPDLKLD